MPRGAQKRPKKKKIVGFVFVFALFTSYYFIILKRLSVFIVSDELEEPGPQGLQLWVAAVESV